MIEKRLKIIPNIELYSLSFLYLNGKLNPNISNTFNILIIEFLISIFVKYKDLFNINNYYKNIILYFKKNKINFYFFNLLFIKIKNFFHLF